MKNKIKKMMNVNKDSFKVNYEALKNYLNYEDYFLEVVLEPTCREHGYKIEFDKEFVILKKMTEEEMEEINEG